MNAAAHPLLQKLLLSGGGKSRRVWAWLALFFGNAFPAFGGGDVVEFPGGAERQQRLRRAGQRLLHRNTHHYGCRYGHARKDSFYGCRRSRNSKRAGCGRSRKTDTGGLPGERIHGRRVGLFYPAFPGSRSRQTPGFSTARLGLDARKARRSHCAGKGISAHLQLCFCPRRKVYPSFPKTP